MSNQQRSRRKRTAVLVVHGMGSQRPLDTVRGIVNAVWLEGLIHPERKIWTHPELSGVDIDLSVITTSSIPSTDHRVADFHELYWAHLMSETRAVAVLLWLFELARKGPRLKSGMRSLWWCAAIFLALLILSVAFLVTQAIERFSGIATEREGLLIALPVMLTIITFVALMAAVLNGAFRLTRWVGAILLVSAAVVAVFYNYGDAIHLATLANNFTPALIAALIVLSVMDGWGLVAFAAAYLLSIASLALAIWAGGPSSIPEGEGWIPWMLTSHWSALAAWIIIAIYVALYAAFLQPYLGDAARYFRNSPGNVAVRREIRKQAVDTLDALHRSGDYDRIVVVAHSLGTVVAYDMLRAYYGRICDSLPDPRTLGPDVQIIDWEKPAREQARKKGRAVIAAIDRAVEPARQRIKADTPQPSARDFRAWLVTDFVTMGSPLTHAHYLMCDGKTTQELDKDFERRVRERQFPTCPPRKLNGDGWLTFKNPNDGLLHFHHGGQFALTRWTNLYFPVSQLLWGDAIGGPVAPIFGYNVVDLAVYESNKKRDSFFAHVLYWVLPQVAAGKAPHIVALQNAIDLADAGIADDLESASKQPVPSSN